MRQRFFFSSGALWGKVHWCFVTIAKTTCYFQIFPKALCKFSLAPGQTFEIFILKKIPFFWLHCKSYKEVLTIIVFPLQDPTSLTVTFRSLELQSMSRQWRGHSHRECMFLSSQGLWSGFHLLFIHFYSLTVVLSLYLTIS